MTADISRHSLRPEQRFTGVVHQQGRIGLDADANEAADLADLQMRQTIADVVCTHGTPDDGFRITDAIVDAEGLDFSIAAGTFFLDGIRCETVGSTYRRQPDRLTFSLDEPGPPVPADDVDRFDLVYLSVWEQVVTATEDTELLEPALSGPDTTARRRMMCQVRVLDDVPDDCEDAFDDLAARLIPEALLDDSGAVHSAATMTVGFTVLEPLEDLCRPSAQAGFLGSRNETYRVEIAAPGRFVWGRDNASPLYRVQVEDFQGDRRRIVFLAPPRDQHGWPLAGMTVELLRWGAQLANTEKAAEPTGLYLRVDNGFDPDDDSIIVTPTVPQAWSDWFATPEGEGAVNPRDEPGFDSYFFLRVWTGGGDGGAVDNDMGSGAAVPLGETGLTVTFAGDALAGDYWIIAARPNTPTLVTPWALLDGAAPAGPRRFLAPLALVAWRDATPKVTDDCRHRFRPLCRIGGCCTVTVGDGHTSVGDVDSIQEAVDRLPAEGGEICISPGEYAENVVVENRRNVTFTGCGRRTRWQGADGRTDALLTIRNSSGVVVRKLAMHGGAGECVVARRAVEIGARRVRLENLLLEDLLLTASDVSAVGVFEIHGCTVRRCEVSLERLSVGLNESTTVGRAPALFLSGEHLTVEHCRILAQQADRGAIRRAYTDRHHVAAGGIHIGGGSEYVIVRENVISGGNGHGITLGSVQYLPPNGGPVVGGAYTANPVNPQVPGATNGFNYYGANFTVDSAGCIHVPGTPPVVVGQPGGPDLHPESAGAVRLVWILRNEIAGMGYSGISAHVFAELGRPGQDFDDAIAVEIIEISENLIRNCMRNEIGEMSPMLRLLVGWGGIALSLCSDATIRDNVIAGNGSSSLEPIAGIFLGLAEDVKIERNRIERNGRAAGSGRAVNPGQRGGIVVGIATGAVSSLGEDLDPDRNVDRPALVVNGNIVDAPSGRALRAITLGPCMVLGNRLTGAGRSAFASNLFQSLSILGIGLSVIRDQVFQPKSAIDLTDYVFLDRLADVLGGDVVNVMSLAVSEDLDFRGRNSAVAGASNPVPQRLRGGELMVNDNQISLQRHSMELGTNLSAVLLLSADDVSFADNQAEVENNLTFVLTNCLVIGASLRFCSNRLQEPRNRAFVSALTWGMMNATTVNQSTHCILAVAPAQGRVFRDNRTVVGMQNPEACASRDRAAQQLSSAVARENGLTTALS